MKSCRMSIINSRNVFLAAGSEVLVCYYYYYCCCDYYDYSSVISIECSNTNKFNSIDATNTCIHICIYICTYVFMYTHTHIHCSQEAPILISVPLAVLLRSAGVNQPSYPEGIVGIFASGFSLDAFGGFALLGALSTTSSGQVL